MSGDIVFIMSGDDTNVKIKLEQIEEQSKNLAKDVATKQEKIIVGNETVDRTINKTVTHAEATKYKYITVMQNLETQMDLLKAKQNAEWHDLTRRRKADISEAEAMFREHLQQIEQLKTKMKQTVLSGKADLQYVESYRKWVEKNVRLTTNNSLTAMRTMIDMAALFTVATGKNLDLQTFVLLQMGMSQVRQMYAQATAMYATGTPYGIIAGSMILSAIPMLTSVISFTQSELAKTQARIDNSMNEQMDGIMDGII